MLLLLCLLKCRSSIIVSKKVTQITDMHFETYVCINDKGKKWCKQAQFLALYLGMTKKKGEAHSLYIRSRRRLSDTLYSLFSNTDSNVSEGRGYMPLGLTWWWRANYIRKTLKQHNWHVEIIPSFFLPS